MSAIPSPAQPVPEGGPAAPPVPSLEIDASCRAPVLLLLVSAAVWLLLGSLLGLIATLKFHSPAILADCPWFTYGRVHAAQLNAFIYGFAAPAGLGVLLWVLAHLGRTRLAFSPGIIAGAVLWNLGVTVGTLGILAGENTGYEWLEMPRYGSVLLFAGYLAIGLGAMLTFHQRREPRLYISQWFLLAAVLWFPWIYTTASLLLVAKPVRGALQTVVDGWYAQNLTIVWLGFIGLAALFYFVPKVTKRPLYSHYLGIFVFWTLAMFGSWGGVQLGAPLPSWLAALSTVGAVLTLVPVVSAGINIHHTAAGNYLKLARDDSFPFLVLGALCYVLAGIAAAFLSLDRFNEIVSFTWFIPARMHWFLYGFFAMTMFGAIYHIVPRLLGVSLSSKLIRVHFLLAVLGIIFHSLPLAFGGLHQGSLLNLTTAPVLDITRSTLPFLRISTTGDLLMLAGHLVLLLNLAGAFYRVGRTVASTAWAANTKTAGVTS
jgi:cytochrome c oxidase cbb3-type subunit I